MHKYALAGALVFALAAPALAEEYFVAFDPSTKECRVVTQRPDDRPASIRDDSSPSLKMVGSGAYKTEAEAQKAISAITDCNKS